MTPKNSTQKIHYTNKPIIWSCDLLPQVGQSIFTHLQSFLCMLLLMTRKKKGDGHQLGPMTHFLTSSKFDPLLYIGEKCLQTHLQSFLCVPLLMTPKIWTQKVHYSCKPIISSCDLLPQVGQSIFTHLQSFLCML